MAAGILGRAELLLQAKNYSGSGNWLDESGNSHDAVNNGARFLAHAGTQYLRLSGVANNHATIPDAGYLDGTGTLEFIVKVAFADWTPAADQSLVSKLDSSGTSGWQFRLDDNGADLRLLWHEGTFRAAQADVMPTVSDGDWLWCRCVAVENGADRDATFYTSTDTTNNPDSVSWSQLGNVITVTNGAGDLTANTETVFFGGATDTAHVINGGLAYVRVILNGTIVADVDFTDTTALAAPYATFTEASSNAATVTINRTATGVKASVVDRDLFLYGTNDYHEIADHANLDFAGPDSTAEPFTLLVVGRHYDVSPAADSVLVFKKDNLTTSLGYGLYVEAGDDTAKFLIGDGTLDDEDASPNLTAGQTFVVAGVRNVTDDDIEAFTDGVGSGSAVTDSTTTTLANAFPLRIGATSNSAASFLDGEIMAVVLWREALTDADLLLVSQQLLSSNPSNLMLLGVG